MELFRDSKTTAETVKAAAIPHTLGLNPDNWPNEVMDILLADHPYLFDYNTQWRQESINQEAGALYGSVLVSPRALAPTDETRQVAIPVQIENRRMHPLDLMRTDLSSPELVYQPLTQRRFEKIMGTFAPGTVAAIPQQFRNSPQPSGLQVFDLGKGSYGSATKMSSLLDAALAEATSDDLVQFHKAASKEVVKAVEVSAAAQVKPFQERLAKVKTASAGPDVESLEPVARASIDPTVIQITRDKDGYVLKAAAAALYRPVVKRLPPAKFDALPKHVKSAVLSTGIFQWSGTDAEMVPVAVEGLDDLSGRCKCAVFQPGGGMVEGTLLPVLRANGKPGGQVFIGPEAHAFQEKVAGIRLGDVEADKLPEARSGFGVFVCPTPEGLVALEACTVKTASVIDGQEKYTAVRGFRMPHHIVKSALVQRPTRQGDPDHGGTVVIPEGSKFVALKKAASVESRADFVKLALRNRANYVTVTSNGDRFTVDGEPVAEVPVADRTAVKMAQAQFILGVVGVAAESAASCLEKAASSKREHLQVPLQVQDPEALEKYASELARQYRDTFGRIRAPGHLVVPLAEVVKSAATIQDGDTLDSILGIGFLNPYNVAMFIDYLPELEAALRKTCTLLLAARFGLGLDETALRVIAEGLDGVIEDLEYIGSDAQSQTAGGSGLPTTDIGGTPGSMAGATPGAAPGGGVQGAPVAGPSPMM